MGNIGSELRLVVESTAVRLGSISEEASQTSRVDGQWSAKQVLGHLIDSAAHNHQRFVRAQFTQDLVFAGYDQEQWIRIQRYDDSEWSALIAFWRSYNLHLAHVIEGIPDDVLTQPRMPHTLDKIAWRPMPADEPATLLYLIQDYMAHLREHLRQLFAVAKSESR